MSKYDVVVQLSGNDGNAFAVLGAVKKGLKKVGAPQSDIDAFMSEAQSGDYDHLLQTAMKWVKVE